MSLKVRVGDRWIGGGDPAFIIAEIGSNHDRKLEQAKQLIDKAAEVGADAVKFQLFLAEELYPAGTPVFLAVKENEFPREWLPELAEYSRKRNLIFLASPFDRQAVDLLEAVDVCAYKWASSETVDLPFLKYAAAKQKPILISTGMCDLADIHEAVEVVRSEGNQDIVLLQCTALYPTEPKYVHLRVMDTLRLAFQVPIGFSDHTLDTVMPALAVARGATVIEKHMTLSRQLPGPDHGYALEPGDFAIMVKHIRMAEAALGSSSKTMLIEEARVARRKSIRAARDIAAGEMLASQHFVVERPADGIRPRFLEAILGRRAKEPIRKGDPITWEQL